MSSIKQRERGDQRVAPQPPQLTPEAADEVIGYNQNRWAHLMGAHRTNMQIAHAALNERLELERQKAELQARINAAEAKRLNAENIAQDAERRAKGPESVLSMYGAELPTLPPVEMPSQGDAGQHAATWSAPETGAFAPPQGPHDAPAADGRCINCRQPIWKSDTAPRGATHSFGPTCDPANKESTYADLGNPPAGGAVQ